MMIIQNSAMKWLGENQTIKNPSLTLVGLIVSSHTHRFVSIRRIYLVVLHLKMLITASSIGLIPPLNTKYFVEKS